MNGHPYIFDEFFASGRDETISPFLSPSSRHWGKHLPLKNAILSAIFLALAFALSFINLNGSNLCLVIVYFLVGTPALLNALEDLRNFEINIDVLMTLAALLSVVIGSGIEGALLLVLFEFSGSMENSVIKKTKSALISLRNLSPKTAYVLENGIAVEKAISEILIGTKIIVRSGEVVPLDGEVISGGSSVNLVHLTGETQPLTKRIGDDVPAGAHNLDGTLTIRVKRTNSDSTLSKIIELVTEAQASKPALQRFFDKFSKIYSTTIISLCIFFSLSLPYVFSMPFFGEEGSIYRALTFLIAASPCALIIATPTAYLSAISSCARKGIILKGGTILDAIATCSTIAFDKTGTLTTGNLTCTAIIPLNDGAFSEDEALSIAAGLETHAVHPIAHAIFSLLRERNLFPIEIDDFLSIPGYGLKGTIQKNGKKIPVSIGHPDFIKQQHPELIQIDQWKKQNTLLLVNDQLFTFLFEDEIRPESITTLPKLIRKNLSIILLTGDHTENSSIVGKELGIKTIYANLRPEDKLAKVAELSEKKGLIMVGDGVNDAPALARATAGISLGKIGSATAIDASDVVFLHDDLSNLNWLYTKSKKTTQIVRENLILALGVITLASLPALLGFIPLWIAVLLHEGGTVIVGLNSLRLLQTKDI